MLNEKLQKWILKSQEGDKDFRILQKKQGNWKIKIERGMQDIDIIYLCIRSKEDILCEEFWEKGKNESMHQDFMIIVKNSKKAILADESGNMWGFGFHESVAAVSFMVCYRISGAFHLIWANSNGTDLNQAFGFCEEGDKADQMDCLFAFLKTNNTNDIREAETNREK